MKHTRLPRALGLAALGTVAALALAACSSDAADTDSTGSAAPETSTSAEADAPESGEPVTLTVWHYYNTDGQVETLNELADTFTKNHPNVTVDYQYVPVDQMTTKAVTAAGAGAGPDVLVFGASGTYDLAQAGAIEPMDWFNDFPDSAQFSGGALQKVDGTLYGVQGFVNLIGLWYNSDMMAELGIDAPPTTIEELEADMAKAVAAGKQGITLTGNPGLESQWQGFPWFTSAGFDYGDAQAKPMADTFAMLQKWIDNGYLSKEATTWDQTIPFQQFASGASLFAVNGNWQIAAAQEAAFEYGVAPLPLSADGGVLLGGEVQNIGALSKNKELAQDYLKETFFSTDGELALLKGFGGMPTRADAASASEISGDPILSVFADIVANQGRPSPSPQVPSKNVNAVEGLVGDFWSKAIAKEDTPQKLADDLLAQLTPLLQG